MIEEIHVHVHSEHDETSRKLFHELQGVSHTLEMLIAVIKHMEEKLMGKFDEVESDIAAINVATNELAARVAVIIGQLADGATPAQLDAAKLELESIQSALNGIAADPSNPVPTVK